MITINDARDLTISASLLGQALTAGDTSATRDASAYLAEVVERCIAKHTGQQFSSFTLKEQTQKIQELYDYIGKSELAAIAVFSGDGEEPEKKPEPSGSA